jgi:hypothetical protein
MDIAAICMRLSHVRHATNIHESLSAKCTLPEDPEFLLAATAASCQQFMKYSASTYAATKSHPSIGILLLNQKKLCLKTSDEAGSRMGTNEGIAEFKIRSQILHVPKTHHQPSRPFFGERLGNATVSNMQK